MIFLLRLFSLADGSYIFLSGAKIFPISIGQRALLLIAPLCLFLTSLRAQTIQFTTLPGTAAVENVPYTGSMFATIDNTDSLTYSVPVLPSWLTLSSDGEGARKINNSKIDYPSGVTMDADNNVYVVQLNSADIYKITPDGNHSLWAKRPIGDSYAALVVGNYLYVSLYWDNVGIYRYNLQSANPVAEPVYTGVSFLSMTYKDGYLYAASHYTGKVYRVKLSDLTASVYVSVPNCFGLGFDPAGNLIIADHNGKKVVKYDPVQESLITVIPSLPFHPSDVKIDATGNLYVSFYNEEKIRRYTPDYSSFVEVTSDALSAFSMTLTPNGTLLYSDYGRGNIYSLQTGVVLTGTPSHADVGDHPVKIAVTNGTVTKEHEFVITVADPNPPVISSYSPAAGAVDQALSPSLTAVFNETIQKGTGNFYVKNKTTNATLQTIDVAGSAVSVTDKTLQITLAANLPVYTDIYITADAGVVKDVNNNDFAGITGSATWYFKTVQKTPQTIDFTATRSVSYGTADFDPGASVTSGLALSYSSSDESVAKIVSGKIRVLKVGTVTITASQAGDDDYLPATSADQALTVTPKDITVSMVEDQSGNKVYDGNTDITLAAAAYALNGVVGDDEVAVSGTTRFSDANAGDTKNILVDNLVLSGNDKDNYTLATNSTTVTGSISPAPLVITAEPQTKDYGTADPALTYQVTGLLPADALTGSLSRHPGNDAGDHDIIQGSLTAGNNYDVEYRGAQLSIQPVPLKITSEAASKTYGAPDPVFSYMAEGLVDGDELTGALTREPGKNVGEYAILQGTLTGGNNYVVTFRPAVLTITPAPLTVRAENKIRDAWQANPAFTFLYNGFVASDNASSLSTQPTAQTAASPSSPAGKYDIVVSGASSPNYTITYLKGELTVNEIDRRDLKVWQSGSQLHIRIFTEHAQKSRLTLFSPSGQMLIMQRQNLQPGVNSFVLQVGNLAPSLYVLYVHADRFKESEQVRINK